MSKKNDPLASVKASVESSALGAPELSLPATPSASREGASEPSLAEVAASSSPDQSSSPSAPSPIEADIPAPVSVLAPAIYKVVRKITVSWGGQFIRLAEGDLISDASYGPRSVERMRECGVAMELVG